MREFVSREMTYSEFNEYVDEVYNIDEGQVFRKREKLERAFRMGMGQDIAPYTMWSAVNAITEVETSTKVRHKQARRQFARANFGAGLAISKRALDVARTLTSAW